MSAARLSLVGTGDAGLTPSRFPSLDRALGGGFRRGELVVLGGDDSAGSSALALALALRSDRQALLLTGEMTPDRVFERALAMSARVGLESLRLGVLSDEERVRLAGATATLHDRSPRVHGLDGGGLAPIARAVEEAPEAALVIVDPLESLLHRDSERDEALGYAVLELKRLALRRQVTVLLTSHLPALDRERRDRRPRLTDFGLGGAVGTHADIVLGLFREELYEADLGVTGAAELLLLKHRDGPRGYVDLYFEARFGRFEDVLEE